MFLNKKVLIPIIMFGKSSLKLTGNGTPEVKTPPEFKYDMSNCIFISKFAKNNILEHLLLICAYSFVTE